MKFVDALGLEPPPVIPERPPRPVPHEIEAPAPPRFHLLSADQLLTRPPMQWAIHSVLPAQGCAAVYGPSGSGKSFLVVDLVAALAEGNPWFGHRIRLPRRVVMIVLEGEAGMRNRIEAWTIEHGRSFPPAVSFVPQPFRLNDRADVLAMAAAIDAAGGADVVVVDTLNRAAPGTDENSSKDMGVVLDHCKELQGMFGGLLVLVHHSGKDQAKGMRGHSSLHAALDAAIEVARADDRREWVVAKSKDGHDGQAHGFRLEVVELGEDEDGEAITSCVVHPDDAPAVHRPRPPKGGNQRIVYDALGPLFRESQHFGKGGAPAMRPCIELEEAIAQVKDRLAVEPKRQAERTRLAITGLVSSGVLGCREGWLWLN